MNIITKTRIMSIMTETTRPKLLAEIDKSIQEHEQFKTQLSQAMLGVKLPAQQNQYSQEIGKVEQKLMNLKAQRNSFANMQEGVQFEAGAIDTVTELKEGDNLDDILNTVVIMKDSIVEEIKPIKPLQQPIHEPKPTAEKEVEEAETEKVVEISTDEKN